MKEKTNKYLITALLLGIAFHGSSMFFTLESTYDALIHLFFANHYANSWFEPWNYSWYTGFTVMGYPPLVHQSIALLSGIGGLKFGMFTVALIGVVLFITGIYRFALLMSNNRTIAGYAAILAVFSSSFVETLHMFGQLPSIIGISILMHSLPEIYSWLRTGKLRHLFMSFSLIAVTVTSHHVTPIFGMVFFIFPVIGMVLMDASKDIVHSTTAITLRVFFQTFLAHFKRIITFGLGSLVLIIGCILPYWINTKNNPITQVPIPHGSRDNFLEITSSGLVFFIIPWGILLIFLPYFFYRYFSKRYLFFGISFTILTILGTGGTTPIPIKILGENAFNILTLDRFTLWASIMALPLFGEFVYRFAEGDIKTFFQNKWGTTYHRIAGGILVGLFIFMTIFTMSLGYFRPSQPAKIKMLPIVNFLNQDQHDQWRYLPLGFGDQMAWLSAQTKAMTVDGNYHSARRLPELTTRAIERLENSKFRGIEGIGSLQQFLTVPEKYHLKYIFSNDKFYDPILYFTGWHRLQRLENGIMVWERAGVPPLPSVLPKDDIPLFQRLLWGIIPITTVLIAFLLNLKNIWQRTLKTEQSHYSKVHKNQTPFKKIKSSIIKVSHFWAGFICLFFIYGCYQFYVKNTSQLSPSNVVKAYYDALDYKNFEKAYSFINPKSEKTKAQYMLEIAVSDGLLSSYAKLNSMETHILKETENFAELEVHTIWVSPLKNISKTFKHQIEKIDGEWYINPSDIDLDIPPDQLVTQNQTVFYNHGRRRLTPEQTPHEDVLKQPVVEVLAAQLVENQGSFAIVGQVQNVDDVPADIAINGIIYSEKNTLLASYNAKDVLKHKLLPKEISNFRINFEGIAWSVTKEQIPKIFNPDQFTPAQFEEIPAVFNLQIKANVATNELFDGLGFQNLSIIDNNLNGTIFNHSTKNATVPQLQITYYDSNKNVLWVENEYLDESIRSQRKASFKYTLPNKLDINPINNSMDLISVNGLPNKAISEKRVPNRIVTHTEIQLMEVLNQPYKYISIKANCFIGAPF